MSEVATHDSVGSHPYLALDQWMQIGYIWHSSIWQAEGEQN